MKTLAAIAVLALTLAPAASAQTTNLTGKWTGTMSGTAPDGSTGSQGIEFNLTQNGKVLTGTAGPNADRQWDIEKGAVDGAKVTFQVQQPDGGPLFTFTLTLVKDHLQGDMVGELGPQTREFKVDLTKAK
jgi:hypothetical protein